MKNSLFEIEIDKASGGLSTLTIANDGSGLNWIEGRRPFGAPYPEYRLISVETIANKTRSVYDCRGVQAVAEYLLEDDGLHAKIVFTNTGEKRVFEKGGLGFTTCFNDNYDKAEICLEKRCHMHVWAGGNTAYIAARRMNGEGNNVALLVTNGKIDGYAITRRQNSNYRGEAHFLLPDTELDKDESVTIEYLLFKYDDLKSFFDKASKYDNFCRISGDFNIKKGEKARLSVFCKQAPRVFYGGKEVPVKASGEGYTVEFTPAEGESRVRAEYGAFETFAEINCVNFDEIVDKRLNFLIDRQQCFDKKSAYDGAYFLFDRETQKTFVEKTPVMNDRNIARERSGITCAMITRLLRGGLSAEQENKYRYSVNMSMKFIDKNIVRDNGQIYDAPKYRRNIFYDRLYNYSMFMLVYALMHKLSGDEHYIKKAGAIARRYYAKGGSHFYAINLPFCAVYEQTRAAGLEKEAEELKALFLAHGDRVAEIGSCYPAHEVKYEQSIVAPSVDILLECYKLSGDEKYLAEARSQMKLLEAFCGFQPSCHLNEIAIRHWDGFWFGKRKLYGDTFPHYWSCINAAVYSKFADATGDNSYKERARKILESNLLLFDGEGNGSCAYLYPDFVNGTPGKFYDPWANDQDWALYFYNVFHK